MLVACKKESQTPNNESLTILHQQLNILLVKDGFCNIDIDKDSKNDYKILLSHQRADIGTDTFFIKIYSLDSYSCIFKKANGLYDSIPCYRLGDKYNGAYSSDSLFVSSSTERTGIEGTGETYIAVTKIEHPNPNDINVTYNHNGWIKISVSKNRDTLKIYDCAIETSKLEGINIGQIQ